MKINRGRVEKRRKLGKDKSERESEGSKEKGESEIICENVKRESKNINIVRVKEENKKNEEKRK